MPYKLLLADDSVTIQRVIELTFADEDVQVVAVSDGDQAIARIDADPPDIVLADVGMPGRDGYEVAAHLKQSPRLAHVPVLLLTGAFEPIDQVRASAAGCDGVLAKPFEPQLVIARVKELLGRGRPPASPAPPIDDLPHPVGAAPSGAALDDYFDRLDVAFSTLSSRPAAEGAADRSQPAPEQIEWVAPGAAPAPAADADLPLSYASRAVEFSRAGAPAAPEPAAAATPVRAVGLPPLADAFAAILAAEQSGAAAAAAALWPAAAPPVPVSDELVEQVAARVLERLPDRVVRETVSTLVSDIAERLVREEIARIKAAIP